ncbi:MAG: alpha/beta hydrolase family protein [Anaerobacillus sp.]|uniref:alpha/beta hydrolase family protein n=1 Tax=Anaerobacillus sp. TaxID=1872506 RepID=UPI0039190EAC
MQKAVEVVHNDQVLRGMAHIPEGDGQFPTVILYHGFTGTKLEPHRIFLKISRALEAKGIASFRFDFLGSGESDGNFEDMTVINEVAEAETIFNYVSSNSSVAKEKIVVLGLSMGGLVASLLAGKLTDQIEKLILMAPAGTMRDLILERVKDVPYIESLNAYDLDGNLVGQDFVDELARLEVWPQAANYKNEVLLIHGTKDLAVPYGVSSLYIEKCYPEATLVPIEEADHTFNAYSWEKQVIDAIVEFVVPESNR